jgi:uncharacterized protein (DUF849 family)
VTLLKACLNGARRPGEHPRLPVAPEEIAADAAAVVAVGAGAIHVHAKDADGVDTLDSDTVGRVVAAVRAAVTDTPVGVTTGAWALPDPAQRVAAVRKWSTLPDFASVNWHEAGADEVAAELLDRGVAVEAGLWHQDAVRAWLASPHRDRCLRLLLEVVEPVDDGLAEADALVTALGPGANDIPVLLHGAGAAAWPVLRDALRRGLDIRIGLEDVLVDVDGLPTAGNAELAAAARSLLPR